MSKMSFETLSNCLFKFLIIGDSGVGKTSITRRFCQNVFMSDAKETIGVEFIPYTIEIEDVPIKLQIWDTAGQEQYRTLSRAYYRNAVGVLIVFSYTDLNSFEHLEQWFDDVRSLCHPMAQIILIGNKLDLEDLQQVSRVSADDFAKAHKVEFIESSAKTNIGIQESFYKLTRTVAEKVISGEIVLSRAGPPGQKVEKKKKSGLCC